MARNHSNNNSDTNENCKQSKKTEETEHERDSQINRQKKTYAEVSQGRWGSSVPLALRSLRSAQKEKRNKQPK